MIDTYLGKKLHTVYKLMYRYVYLEYLKVLAIVRKKLEKPFHCDVAIIDDFIPNPMGGFRSSEFEYLLRNIPGAYIFTIIGSKISKKKQFQYFNTKSVRQFNDNKAQFCKEYELSPERIKPFHSWTKVKPKLAYTVFLDNAYYLIDYFEEYNIPFVLELYPGGGFGIATEGRNYEQLKRVLSSPCLRKVFVTQKIAYRFIKEQKLCTNDKIGFHYGGILSPVLFGRPKKEVRYPGDKSVIDICFVAAKYMPRGLDKGYDIFIDMAHLAFQQNTDFRFHVVGGFDENDIPIEPELRKHFKFYGYLKGSDFAGFYGKMDIIISPTRPFVRQQGEFDGYPTTTCAEAGLNGVCIVLSDPLNMNVGLVNGESVIIVNNDPIEFADKIIELSRNPEEIYRIGTNGQIAFNADPPENQLKYRLKLISKCLERL